MKNIFNYIIPVFLFTPMVAAAQFAAGDDGIDTFFSGANELINGYLITGLLALAFLMFIIGIAQYFFLGGGGENADDRKKGRTLMIWGIIAFVVIVSVWGLVGLIAGGLGLEGQDLDNVPDTPTI